MLREAGTPAGEGIMATLFGDSSGTLRRDAGRVGLLFASTTSMIGSGWLFGAFDAARLAGPWSIASWIVGAAIILIVALCFAELATMFPRSGAVVHMSHASHGAGIGRIWGWLLFLTYVSTPAIEAEGVITYANNYLPWFIQPGTGGVLSGAGFAAAVGLMLVFAVVNLLAVRWLMNVNSTVTWWKIAIPGLTVVALLAASVHPGNLEAAPESYSTAGIFTALPAAGIVFSFLGFRTAIDLAGETRDPGRSVPFAVIGSVILATLIYIGLQVAFVLAVSPGDIAGGWDHLQFAGSTGPFAGLAATLGLTWLAILLYADAYVSPAGTGLIFVTAGSRVLHANGSLGAGPKHLTRLTAYGIPWVGVLVMWAAGCLFLLPFPAWSRMAAYISSITVLTYGLGPIALLCLRRNAPHAERPFLLPGAGLIAPLAFIASNWIIFWAGFSTVSWLFSLIAIGFAAYVVYFHLVARNPAREFGWRQISWLLPWFGGMWILSALGGQGGGLGVLSFPVEIVVIALWSLLVLALAMRLSLDPHETRRAIDGILATPGTRPADAAA